jgi:hypothetical protein
MSPTLYGLMCLQVPSLSPHMESQGFYREAKAWQGRQESQSDRRPRSPSSPRVPKSPAGFARHVERSRAATPPTRALDGQKKSPRAVSTHPMASPFARGVGRLCVVVREPSEE